MDENFQSCLRISIVHQNRMDHPYLSFSNRGLKPDQKRKLHHEIIPNFFILEVQNFDKAAQISNVDGNY